MCERKCRYIDKINHCTNCYPKEVNCAFKHDNNWESAKEVCKYYDAEPLFKLEDHEHISYTLRSGNTIYLTLEQIRELQWALNQENNGLPDW